MRDEGVAAERRAVLLIRLLVIASIFAGFINLIPTPFMAATILIDGIVGIMLLGAIARLVRSGRVPSWAPLVMLVALCGSVLLFHRSGEGLWTQILALRSAILYAFAGIYVAVSLRTHAAVTAVAATVMRAGLIIAAFGCVQFVGRSWLPDWLLFPADTFLFSYYGTDITRSNGLVGNTIVYGALLGLVFALWVGAALRAGERSAGDRWGTAAAAVLVGLGVLSTFSRIGIASAAVMLAATVIYALIKRRSRAIPVGVGVGLLGAIIFVIGMLDERTRTIISESFIWQGLILGDNASAAASADVHFTFQQLAWESFQRNPLFGVGLGTQSQDSANASSTLVITDGFHLSTAVEGGLVLIVPTLLLFVALLVQLVRSARQADQSIKWLPIAVLLYLGTQLALAGFYNTGFYGKVPNVIFWVCMGLCTALAAGGRPREGWLGHQHMLEDGSPASPIMSSPPIPRTSSVADGS